MGLVEFKVAKATKNSETIFCIIFIISLDFFYRCNWREILDYFVIYLDFFYRCNWRDLLVDPPPLQNYYL